MVQMNLVPGQEQRCRCREWTFGHSKETGELNELSVTDIYTLAHEKWIANGNLLCSTGSSTWYLMTQRHRMLGREIRGRSKREGICVAHIADSLHCTAEMSTTSSSNYTLNKNFKSACPQIAGSVLYPKLLFSVLFQVPEMPSVVFQACVRISSLPYVCTMRGLVYPAEYSGV